MQLEIAALGRWLVGAPGDLVAADSDLIDRIARDASSPDEAVQAMLDARSNAGEMVSSAIAVASEVLFRGPSRRRDVARSRR